MDDSDHSPTEAESPSGTHRTLQSTSTTNTSSTSGPREGKPRTRRQQSQPRLSKNQNQKLKQKSSSAKVLTTRVSREGKPAKPTNIKPLHLSPLLVDLAENSDSDISPWASWRSGGESARGMSLRIIQHVRLVLRTISFVSATPHLHAQFPSVLTKGPFNRPASPLVDPKNVIKDSGVSQVEKSLESLQVHARRLIVGERDFIRA